MSSDVGSTRLPRGLEALARVQVAHPWIVLLCAALSVCASLTLALRLSLKTSFSELLPQNKESVIVADRVNARLASLSTLTVVAEGSDNAGLKRFVDALAPELRKIGRPWVGLVDEGVQDTQRFFEEHRLLYAPLKMVQQIRDEIVERYDYEVAKRMDLLLDDDEPPPPLTEASIRKRLEERARQAESQAKSVSQFPGGYYLDEKNHVAVVLIRTPIGSGDLVQSRQLQDRVLEAVQRAQPKKYDPKIHVGLGGNLLTSAETRAQIEDDLQHVGVWGVSLILGIVFLYYLRVRMLVAMTLTVGIGAVWTFGLAYLLIGHLNSSTGFLFSIVVGNGINFGIIFMARYLEARRDQTAENSVRTAHRDTWVSTLTASAAATAAYGSLAVTDFRGFKHFGVIGGTGMLLCWAATFAFLPAILILFERRWPISQSTSGLVARFRGLYGRPFAGIATGFPRAVASFALIVTALCSVLAVRYVAEDPMEYNMRNIDNDRVDVRSEARRLDSIVDGIVGRQRQDGIAVATDRLDQIKPLKAALERRRDAARAGHKPFDKAITIYSLLPSHQKRKIELARESRQVIERAYRRGFITERDWRKVNELISDEQLKPIGIADLPEQVVRHFTEKDGTRGRLLYLTPTPGRSVWDGRYLIEWADSFRRTELPDGSIVQGSGRSVIYADMILAVAEDAPKAITASLLATLVIVFLAFRGRAGAWVIVSVVTGLVWTLAILSVYDSQWPWSGSGVFEPTPLKLNFLNFVALPITIGVGADYAVNVMQRYRLAGGVMRRVVVETGGAVVLCSLTTMLGYFALTLSVNRAVQSFGVAAAAGEICCVLTGVLVLPACLVWLDSRRKAGADRAEFAERT